MIKDSEINKLEDLDKLRSAPTLNETQSTLLLKQIKVIIKETDWLTIGVMSPSLKKGIKAIRNIERKYNYKEMKCITLPSSSGPVIIKANQKTSEISCKLLRYMLYYSFS